MAVLTQFIPGSSENHRERMTMVVMRSLSVCPFSAAARSLSR